MYPNIDYSITFACLNQLSYTQLFVHSLIKSGVDLSRVVAVDNHSTDETVSFLRSMNIETITNNKNLGCGTAWNQGVLSRQTEWTIVMNNDVICHSSWIAGLLNCAIKQNLKIASPGMIEGVYNDDFYRIADDLSEKMKNYVRPNTAHAVCMAIHHSVWDQIGFFMPVPRLLGYEDSVFFQRAREQSIAMGIVGASWIHHFGMTTQKAMKMELAMDARDSLGDRSLLRHYMNVNGFRRHLDRLIKKRTHANILKREFMSFGASVHGIRSNENIQWI